MSQDSQPPLRNTQSTPPSKAASPPPLPSAQPAPESQTSSSRSSWPAKLRPFLGSVASISVALIGWLTRESRAVVSATSAQTSRLLIFAKTRWRGRVLAKAFQAARESLGVTIHRTGKGDSGTTQRISELNQQIESPDAKPAAMWRLKGERRELTLRLADAALTQGVPPTGAEREYQEVERVRMALDEHNVQLQSMRVSLPPSRFADWCRIGIGYSLVLTIMILMLVLVRPGQRRHEPSGVASSPESIPARQGAAGAVSDAEPVSDTTNRRTGSVPVKDLIHEMVEAGFRSYDSGGFTHVDFVDVNRYVQSGSPDAHTAADTAHQRRIKLETYALLRQQIGLYLAA
jgi:hypothetical protein